MAQPSTPSGAPHSIFGSGAPSTGVNQLSGGTVLTPSSATSSNNTFLMPNSPVKGRLSMDGYRPKVTRTLGQRPACLVNASVTYCGNNQIYAFGGFDQYTDEVYNHVLKLDMVSHQWSLVDNYGDIPGVRMGAAGPTPRDFFMAD
jgi:Kelch motif